MSKIATEDGTEIFGGPGDDFIQSQRAGGEKFERNDERLIARDLTKLMVSNIEQGRLSAHTLPSGPLQDRRSEVL